MTLGANIKKCRKEKGLTQKKLALMANISRSYLADVENERYNPSLDVLQSIAKGLEITAQQLLKDDMNENDYIDGLEDELKIIVEKIKKISPSDREKLLKMIDIFEDKSNK